MLQVAVLCFLLGSAHSFTLSKNKLDKNEETSGMNNSGSKGRLFAHGPKGNTTKEDFSISALLEKANKNLGKRPTDPVIRELDIAVGYGMQNADPCTANKCKWPKDPDGCVYVPYRISNQYTQNERSFIKAGLRSFSGRTCIRFIPRTRENDFLDIVSDNGCYSYIGRQRGPQNVSLERPGCLYKGTVQHELLHALGFWHEQNRSDRDQHIRILWENIEAGQEHNFKKRETNNLRTPYDYCSIMQYSRYAFSGNGKPTLVPTPNSNVDIGLATEMNNNDILRVNRLYNCFGSTVRMLQVTLLCLLLGSAHFLTVSKTTFDENEESSGMNRGDSDSVGRMFAYGPKDNSSEKGDFSISTLLEKANKNLGKRPTDPMIRELDIAVGYGLQNADPCTADECKWPKARNGKVYIPYRISSQYSIKEKDIIKDGLRSFARRKNSRPRTCIRFIPRTTERDFLDIVSDDGCYSYFGRQGGPQNVSLDREGCLYKSLVQHELLHALGFHHEQNRSDRDEHVKIMWENIEPGLEDQFTKVETNNLRTPYDYNSVMQYGRNFFSKNEAATIVPIPDPNVAIGTATKMSKNDFRRINRLFCRGK